MKIPNVSSIVAILCVFGISLANVPNTTHSLSRARDQQASAQQETQAAIELQLEPARRLFLAARLPFEPKELMRPKWRAELAPVLKSLPQMEAVRFLDEPLTGTQLADTLCLPEQVELTGDAVILVRNLRFEGTAPVIRGNHNIYLFLVESVGVLGTTLDELVGKGKQRLASMNPGAARDVPLDIALRPCLEQTQITIDTHGDGYDEWVTRNRGRQKRVQQGDRMAINADRDTSKENQTGIGATGSPGSQGNFADPNPGARGADGACGNTTTVNGGKGQTGGDGGDAGTAGTGGQGPPGDSGGSIVLSASVIGTDQQWTLKSWGGRGGKGGPGGFAFDGKPGANGGPGGPGKDCQCTQGGTGRGGQGGQGGTGGRGGNGGRGGKGGDGGTGGPITYTLPCNYTGSINPDAHKGGVGLPGDSTSPGAGGAPGSPGAPAPAPSNSNCSVTTGGAGAPGEPAIPPSFGPGSLPDPPEENTNGGQDGLVTPNPATGCNEGGGGGGYPFGCGSCDYQREVDCAAYDGFLG
jgi:hypothetical protein